VIASGLARTSRPRGWLVVALCGLTLFLAIVGYLAEMKNWLAAPPSWAPLTSALHAAVGCAFVGVGLVAWRLHPQRRLGPLMVLEGVAWYAIDLTIWRPSSVVLFLLSWSLGWLVFAVLVQVLLADGSGRLRSGLDRVLVGLAYAVGLAGSVGVLTTYDPTWSGSAAIENPLLIRSDPALFSDVFRATEIAKLLVYLAVVAVVSIRWRRASAPARRALGPVLVPRAVAAAIFALAAVPGVVAPFVDSSFLGGFEFSKGVSIVQAGVYLLIPFALMAGLLKSELARGAVADMVVQLGSTPAAAGGLEQALRDVLGDPSARLIHWLPERSGFTDGEGRPVALGGDPSRAVTTLVRDGRPVAAVVHDPALQLSPGLVEAACAAAGLALENERLQIELRAQLAELRSSRSRLVEAGDAERRRLERNLHDGAQQRLVGLALRLRLAARAADGPAAAMIDDAMGELGCALGELRELARGLHPALLTDHGLAAAIQSLAARAPLPVDVHVALEARLPPPVEAAAYFLVAEALTNVAKHASASAAGVHVEVDEERLTIEVADDGRGGAAIRPGSGLSGLADRLATLDGRLRIHSPSGRGTRLRAEIPLRPR
jgi:signal transduction histidine kinase